MLNRGDGMILIMIFFLQNKKYTAVVLASVATLFLPIISSAQNSIVKNEYIPLAAGLDKIYTTSTTFGQFLNSLFNIALTLGAVLAVLIIATAGLQYMTTDAVSGKTSGKEGIQRAVTGILMLLGIWLFFETINPDITDLGFTMPPAVVEQSDASRRAALNLIIPGSYTGTSYTSPTWTTIPNDQYCKDVRGPEWVGIDPHHCPSVAANAGDRCCGINPNYVAPTPQGDPLTSESYYPPDEVADIPTGSWCYTLSDNAGLACFGDSNSCENTLPNDSQASGICSQK